MTIAIVRTGVTSPGRVLVQMDDSIARILAILAHTYQVHESETGSVVSKPECCDGSDEADGVCENKCDMIGAAYRAEQVAVTKVRKTGAKIRSSYITFAKKEKTRLEELISTIRKDVEAKKRDVGRTKDILQQVESLDAAALEVKKQSPLFHSLQKHNAAIRALDTRSRRLQESIHKLEGLLNDLESGYNPNYVDMAVISTVKAWKKMKGESDKEDEPDKKVESQEEEKAAASEKDANEDADEEADEEESETDKEDAKWTDYAISELTERTDYVTLMLDHERHVSQGLNGDKAKVLLFSLEDYLPDALVPTYESARRSLIDILASMGVIPKSGDTSAEASRAREAHTQATSALSTKERELENEEEALSKLFDPKWYGKEGEWRRLHGTCLKKDGGEYTYEVCLFGQATQTSNKDRSSNNLGSFTSWSKSPSVTPGEYEYYTTQHYERGTQCWNGPQRSVQLQLSCGTENELLSVTEPEKCEYHIVALAPPQTAPAVVHHPTVMASAARPNTNPSSGSSSSRSATSRTLGSPRRLASQRSLPLVQAASTSSVAPALPTASAAPALLPRPSSPVRSTIAEISTFPSTDLLRLLAQLLQRIATSNDKIYHANSQSRNSSTLSHSRTYSFDESPAPPPPSSRSTPLYASLTSASRASVASPTSPLFFHARNVPTISIESYLLRILKYCPTTNEVFLSLLVYFDRMGKLGDSVQKEWEASADEMFDQGVMPPSWASPLVIDSYNVHRLIIAGVTVASKFFSDVFYTNSRYAKVGGLPTLELNKLELQFLLLNDFRLAIRPEELQRYYEALLAYSANGSPSPRVPGSSVTSPADELFGDGGSVTIPQPVSPPSYNKSALPPLHTTNGYYSNNDSEPPTSSSVSSSIAPTPSTTASNDVASSSSASTITQSTFVRPTDFGEPMEERNTPTNSNSDERVTLWEAGVPIASGADTPAETLTSETGTEVGEETDDEPTIRVNTHVSVDSSAVDGDDDGEDDAGRRTPNRRPVHKLSDGGHSQYSSYTQTDFGEDENGYEIIPGIKRAESPAASLRFVDGQWDRGSSAREREKRYEADNDEEDEANVTEDEVVYRGSTAMVSSRRGHSAGPPM
ncbi:hypothetical protein FRB99_002730 [Tulasnella sp. 403]|nr:hypothetical protein FRB99_002730 [Tulasnella sp. 403]